MSNVKEKPKAKEFLIQRDYNALMNWASDISNPQRVLLSLAYDADELIRWRAIEAIGKVAGVRAQNGIEKLKNLIRQQLWLMNDESGGLGWHSPEIIGEILVNVPQLINEYASLFPTYFDEEPFERGSRLAVYRIATIDPTPFVEYVDRLKESLNQPDTYIQAYTIMALSEIDLEQIKNIKSRLTAKTEVVRIYDFSTGQMEATDLKQIIEKARNRYRASIKAA